MSDALFGILYLAIALFGFFILFCLVEWLFTLLLKIPAVRRKVRRFLGF